MNLPFKPASLKQREEFYTNEFNIKRVKEWFKKNSRSFPQLFAVDMGSETGIIKNKAKKGKMINLRAENLREKFLYYLPEDVYYDRNLYKAPEKVLEELNFKQIWQSDNLLGQQLAFDIDPENIDKKCKFPNFSVECTLKTITYALQLGDLLKQNFSKIGYVYSGRGMHVHVFDKDAFYLTPRQREELNKQAIQFKIDPWVSRGYIRLIRLPYSLNGLVSRVVIPLSKAKLEKFNPLTSKIIVPKFLS